MSSSGSVTKLIRRIKEGDAAADQELVVRYFRRLLGLARAKLQGKCLRAADEDDVVQSALYGFFLGAERGQYPELHDRDDLWQLLVKIITRKVQKLIKHEEAQKRNPKTRSARKGSCGPEGTPLPDRDMEHLADPKLPPDLEILAQEEIAHLLRRLGNPQLQSIVGWKCEGYTNEEIATMLGCTTRTIERKLNLIRTIWAKEDAK